MFLGPTLTRLSICLIIALTTAGCVRRRLTVRTNPPGASVFVDKQLIGTSPAATSFVYYGTREIEVVRDGYRTEKVLRTISKPWYQVPPLDFFSETLWPWEIRDEEIIDISMLPAQTMASEELQLRADTMRLQASQGLATPLPPPAADSGLYPVLPPGTVYPPAPIDPTYPPPSPPLVSTPPPAPWRPGQYLWDFLLPSGQPPTRIPEGQVLPSYRPDIE